MGDKALRIILLFAVMGLSLTLFFSGRSERQLQRAVLDNLIAQECVKVCAMASEPDRTDAQKKDIQFCVRKDYCNL
tara:strand:- start:356 stop:583 length:228 start_codon:yes stop_codon:yes gene_type:complete